MSSNKKHLHMSFANAMLLHAATHTADATRRIRMKMYRQIRQLLLHGSLTT